MVYPHGSGSIAPAARCLLRARVVLPVAGPPLDNGAVLIAGDRVLAVGAFDALRDEPHNQKFDLGDAILMPGLVNAHCHLDYTDLAGRIGPTASFSEWIKAILALKSGQMYSDYALAWLRGARTLVCNGTTTVADAEAVPLLLPEVLLATPLRVCSFLELTGLRSRRTAAVIVGDAQNKIRSLTAAACWAGLAPHAPYSTTAELLRLSAETARQEGWLVSTHVAESAEEFEMFMAKTGRMADWLKDLRSLSDCGRGSPVRHVHRQGLLGPNFLAVHANYLAPDDAELLGRAGASVVHCPRSHAYFRHAPFPYETLVKAGVNVCLGTDSLASVEVRDSKLPELDMFSEIRTFAHKHPNVPPETVVRMATQNGARALGTEGRLGQIAPGACADMVAIPFSGHGRSAWTGVVQHQGPVAGVMINGRWVVQPAAT